MHAIIRLSIWIPDGFYLAYLSSTLPLSSHAVRACPFVCSLSQRKFLRAFIEQAGRVVSREELCKAVWGDKTFVDFEASLNFCVCQVRSALQDNPLQPNYIRTVPKSGYQFIAPVRPLSAKLPDAGKVGATPP